MTSQSEEHYLQHQYLAQALDPIHVGTGEFRLGRVDNTIVREAGTNLPKIPGSSLAGVTRAYAAMVFGKYRWKDRSNRERSCAGKGGPRGESHCGQPDCRVCTTFGFSIDKYSFQGLAQFSDARILLFPVYSAAGPVWMTCPEALESAGCKAGARPWHEWNAALSGGGEERILVLGTTLPDPVNLGWLYLRQLGGTERPPSPAEWKLSVGGQEVKLGETPGLRPVLDRLVLVSNERFCGIVDDQLEVRTSVSISPETGAAEEGALFTAEAVPRGTFLVFQVTCLQPKYFRVPCRDGGDGRQIKYNHEPAIPADIAGNVNSGLRMIEFLGIGGVNTRGMGRLRVWPV